MNNKIYLILTLISLISFSTLAIEPNSNVTQSEKLLALKYKKWIHGSKNCQTNTDPAIDIFRFDDSSFILRQNKCLSYEAPFIYVLFGKERVLVLDTGATESEKEFPIYKTITSLVEEHKTSNGGRELGITVLHSHNHSDHYAGDSQFEGKPNVDLVKPKTNNFERFINKNRSRIGELRIDLGEREVIVIPTPGHQEEAITFYDYQTKWLLTGDSFYPGFLYVKNWDDYKQSIAKLVAFSKTHEVSALLGSHVEKTSKPGEFYSVGTVYQPDESSLALGIDDLLELDSRLKASQKPREIQANNFIVIPVNSIQKTLSNIVRWFIN